MTAAAAVAVLLAVPCAQLLHEVTHYTAARAFGVPAAMRVRLLRPMAVRYDASSLSGRERVLKTTAIDTAPTIVGATLAVLWLLHGAPTPWSLWTLAAGLAWVFYSVPSPEDLSA